MLGTFSKLHNTVHDFLTLNAKQNLMQLSQINTRLRRSRTFISSISDIPLLALNIISSILAPSNPILVWRGDRRVCAEYRYRGLSRWPSDKIIGGKTCVSLCKSWWKTPLNVNASKQTGNYHAICPKKGLFYLLIIVSTFILPVILISQIGMPHNKKDSILSTSIFM